MKKQMIILYLLVVTLILCACGSSAPDVKPNADVRLEDVIQSEPSTETPADKAVTIEPVVAVENDLCRIEITGVEPNTLFGYEIKLDLENKSQDKTFMYTAESVSVNGVMCDAMFASEVAPGKKSIENVTLMTNALEEAGIEKYTDIEISFRVYDSEDWSAENVAEETVNLYPYGKENVETFRRVPQTEDVLIFQNDKVSAAVIGYKVDTIWGFAIQVYLENNTDSPVMFSAEDVSVNGYMCDPFFAAEVAPHKCKFASISWFDTALEEIGVTDPAQIQEIELGLRAYNSDDWFAGDFAKEKTVLRPSLS